MDVVPVIVEWKEASVRAVWWFAPSSAWSVLLLVSSCACSLFSLQFWLF
jgi:hypothetical protein